MWRATTGSINGVFGKEKADGSQTAQTNPARGDRRIGETRPRRNPSCGFVVGAHRAKAAAARRMPTTSVEWAALVVALAVAMANTILARDGDFCAGRRMPRRRSRAPPTLHTRSVNLSLTPPACRRGDAAVGLRRRTNRRWRTWWVRRAARTT